MKVKELKNYKDNLYSALSRDLSEFEKNFLLIVGGILAFSITFIQDIVKIEDADFFYLLFIGWGLIAVSLGLMMFTFLLSANSSNALWKSVDDFLVTNNLFNDEDDLSQSDARNIKIQVNSIYYGSKKTLKRMRHASVIIFLTGLAFFSTFVGLNILQESNMKNEDTKVMVISNGKIQELNLDLNNIKLKSTDSLIIINK